MTEKSDMQLKIRPLTPDLWPALEDLFGHKGACNGCWCMYWRIGAAYRKRPGDKNKFEFREIVQTGPPPGLLAFDGDRAVGWCQLTPRDALPWLDSHLATQTSGRPASGRCPASMSASAIAKEESRRHSSPQRSKPHSVPTRPRSKPILWMHPNPQAPPAPVTSPPSRVPDSKPSPATRHPAPS
jgi:hypothetical protein